jgi:hypothetical protein
VPIVKKCDSEMVTKLRQRADSLRVEKTSVTLSVSELIEMTFPESKAR